MKINKTITLLAAAGLAFAASCNTQAGVINLALTLEDNLQIKAVLDAQLSQVKATVNEVGSFISGASSGVDQFANCASYTTNTAELPAQPMQDAISYDAEYTAGVFTRGLLTFTANQGSKATVRIFNNGVGTSEDSKNTYNDIQLTKCFSMVFSTHNKNTKQDIGGNDIKIDGILPDALASLTSLYEMPLNADGVPFTTAFALGYASVGVDNNNLGVSHALWNNTVNIPMDKVTEADIGGANTAIENAFNQAKNSGGSAITKDGEPLWACSASVHATETDTKLVASGSLIVSGDPDFAAMTARYTCS